MKHFTRAFIIAHAINTISLILRVTSAHIMVPSVHVIPCDICPGPGLFSHASRNHFFNRKEFKHAMEFEGPYEITKVNDNGTVRFQKGIVNDVINLRNIKPFHE